MRIIFIPREDQQKVEKVIARLVKKYKQDFTKEELDASRDLHSGINRGAEEKGILIARAN